LKAPKLLRRIFTYSFHFLLFLGYSSSEHLNPLDLFLVMDQCSLHGRVQQFDKPGRSDIIVSAQSLGELGVILYKERGTRVTIYPDTGVIREFPKLEWHTILVY